MSTRWTQADVDRLTGGNNTPPVRQSEDDLQRSCVRWFALTYPLLWKGKRLHHSPNGGKRNPVEAAKFKAMGVQPGFPDLFLSIPKGTFAGLFIELKAGRNDLTEHQKAFAREHHQDYCCRVVRSLDEFMTDVNTYLNL